MQTGNAVGDDLRRYLPATMELVLLSMAFSIVVGIPLGMLAAVRRNRPFDHAMRVLAVSGVALPAFWAALLLQLVFAVHLGWLPTSGQLSVATAPPPPVTGMILLDALIAGIWPVFLEAARYAVLPAFVLALAVRGGDRAGQPGRDDRGDGGRLRDRRPGARRVAAGE